LRQKKPDRTPRATTPPVAWPRWLLLPILLAVTLTAYYPAWHGERVWDDDGHMTRADLAEADGLRRIWLEPGATQQYYPVLHSAFWLQHQLWRDSTLGHHLVNIVLHAISAFLVALIVWRLRVPGAPLAALIFALHPVHVESVAWISELKNTLSGVFFLGAGLAYLRWDGSRARGVYAAALALFVLAVLSKSVTATLPAGLLVILWWRHGRLEVRPHVVPLVPFFVVGAAMGAVTVLFERGVIGAQGAEFEFTFVERTLIAGRASWFYAWSLAWPLNLSFNYPRWSIDASAWWQYLFPLGVVTTLAWLWTIRHRTLAPLAGVLFFLITVAPALGFVNVYPFRFSFVADHFQYLASLGLITLAAAAVARMTGGAQGAVSSPAGRVLSAASPTWCSGPKARATGEGPARHVGRPVRGHPREVLKPAFAVVTAVVGVVLGALTWQQAGHYRDAETLYAATLERNPDSWLAHNNLAALRLERPDAGSAAAALEHARASLSVQPEDNPVAHYSAGMALERLGQFDSAVEHYRASLEQFGPARPPQPRVARTWNRMGKALAAGGRDDDALTAFSRGVEFDPGDPGMHTDLGVALARASRVPEAIEVFEEAARLAPTADALSNLGGALLQAGRFEAAVAQFEAAVRLHPALVDAHYNRALALDRLDRHAEALDAYRQVLALGVASADLHNDIGALLVELGQPSEAARHFRAALQLDPSHAAAEANLRAIER
jgi:protein O-mannosyl-transferase